MTATSFQIDSARLSDLDRIAELLTDLQLPPDGLDGHLATTLVARDGADGGRIVGSAALEVYADGVLLRSVAVAADRQGQALGRELTLAAIRMAGELRAPAIYLLTLTAERYFPRFGFERIARDEVPPTVQQSIEFRSACPASAVVMRKRL